MYPPESLQQWLKDFALSYSTEEIIEPVKMSGVKCRRKIMLAPNRRYRWRADFDQMLPSVCKTYHETSAGVWKGYGKMGVAGTMVWKTAVPSAREEDTSRAVIRHWKIWRGDRIVTASFFRVGVRSGAWIMSPGGVVECVAKPPMDSEPLATVSKLRPGPGHLKVYHQQVQVPNPDRPRWDEWAKMIQAVRGFVDNEVRENRVLLANERTEEPCCDCGKFGSLLFDPWRLVHGRMYCPGCYRMLGTKPEE